MVTARPWTIAFIFPELSEPWKGVCRRYPEMQVDILNLESS